MNQHLLKYFIAVLITIILAQPSVASLNRYEALEPRDVGELSFGNQDGYPLQLSEFKGKVVLLNIWSLGCGPCIAEMPSLDHLAGMFPDEDLAVVPINIDPVKGAGLRAFYNKSRYQYLNIYMDPKGQTREVLGWKAMPTTYIFNREGKLVGRLVGAAAWDGPEAQEIIKAYIEGRTPPVKAGFFDKVKNFFGGMIGKNNGTQN